MRIRLKRDNKKPRYLAGKQGDVLNIDAKLAKVAIEDGLAESLGDEPAPQPVNAPTESTEVPKPETPEQPQQPARRRTRTNR